MVLDKLSSASPLTVLRQNPSRLGYYHRTSEVEILEHSYILAAHDQSDSIEDTLLDLACHEYRLRRC